MRNLLIGLLGAAVLGTGGYAAASGLDDAGRAGTVSLPGAAAAAGTTTATTTASTGTTTTGEGEDVSGPCDEAEHADDPRCTGTVATPDDDHAARGGDDEHDGDENENEDEDDEHDDGSDDDENDGGDDDEDRSGSNSGRG